jgi:hypothetical protein
MIFRWLVVSAVAFISLDFAAGAAHAQARSHGPGRSSYLNTLNRPVISPIFNLDRAGGTAAENYFNLVRPQVDQRAATLRQGGQLNQLRHEVETSPGFHGSAVARMSPTGHHAEFMNMSHFHPSGGSGGKRSR